MIFLKNKIFIFFIFFANYLDAQETKNFNVIVILPADKKPALIKHGLRHLGATFIDSKDYGKNPAKIWHKWHTHDKINLVVGGYNEAEIPSLSQYSQQFQIPTLVLSAPPVTLNPNVSYQASEFLFFLYPTPRNMLEFTLKYAKMQNLHEFGLFYSQDYVYKQDIEYLKKNHVKSNKIFTYIRRDFTSLDRAVREFLELDRRHDERDEEYLKAFEQAKELATKSNKPFRQEDILVAPKPNVDAVMVLGDGAFVRHFAKILRFYRVKKLPLIGTSDWRQKILIEQPFDYFLEGSFFADLVSHYPKHINEEPFFATSARALDYDYEMIGEKVAEFIKAEFSKQKNFKNLKKMGDQNSFWPYYILTLHSYGFAFHTGN